MKSKYEKAVEIITKVATKIGETGAAMNTETKDPRGVASALALMFVRDNMPQVYEDYKAGIA